MKVKLMAALILCSDLVLGFDESLIYSPQSPKVLEQKDLCKMNIEHFQYYLFISESMSEDELMQTFKYYEGEQNVILVFRGITPNENIASFINRMQSRLAHFPKGINMQINPELYRKYSISVVPALVMTDKSENAIARVDGITDYLYLKNRCDCKCLQHPANFGVRGPVLPINERDIVDLIKERIASLDLENLKKHAVKNFWTHQKIFNLPHAKKYSIRNIVPKSVLKNDVKYQDPSTGKVVTVFKAGTVVNPLKVRKFDLTLIVFNPSNSNEIKKVQDWVKNFQPKNPKFITTGMEDNYGWAEHRKISDLLGEHIYLLTSEIINSFDIRATPTIVMSEDNQESIAVIELGD